MTLKKEKTKKGRLSLLNDTSGHGTDTQCFSSTSSSSHSESPLLVKHKPKSYFSQFKNNVHSIQSRYGPNHRQLVKRDGAVMDLGQNYSLFA